MKQLLLFVARAATFGAVSGVVFFTLVSLLAPDWLHLRRPVVLNTPTPVTRTESVSSYSGGALRAIPSVVSVYAAPPERSRLPSNPLWPFGAPEEEGGGGLGSGVVMSADGYVLTNNHVVQGAGAVAVELGKGQPAKARVVGTDPETDLAVLKIEAEGLQPIALPSSSRGTTDSTPSCVAGARSISR